MFDNLPVLTLLWTMPLIGLLGIFLIGNHAKYAMQNTRKLAFFVSLFTFLFSLFILLNFDHQSEKFQFVERYTWLPILNFHYYLGLDGISISFVVLSSFMSVIAVMASWNSITRHTKSFYGSLLILESAIIGAFSSIDMVMFFIFFEAVLIPMFVIIGVWGGENRVYSSFKIVLYTLTGSILMLVAIVVMCSQMDSTSIKLASNFNFSPDIQCGLWLAFFLAFAVKTPMVPFHSWLPDAHVQAPAAGSIMLAGVLLKLGGYGILRFLLPMFPEASQTFAPLVQVLSVIAILYGSLVALAQTDIKKLIAYSSIAHMGYVTLGLFTFKYEGMAGAMYQMLSHGVISGALFMCVGILYQQTHTRDIQDYGGVVNTMPNFTLLFFLLTLGMIGLPGTSGFVGEFLVLITSYHISLFVTALAGLGIILGAVYALYLFKRVFLGKVVHESIKSLKDVTGIEKSALIALVFVMFWMGIYPKPFIRIFDVCIKDIATIYAEGTFHD